MSILLEVKYIFSSEKDKKHFFKAVEKQNIGEISRTEKGNLRYEYYFTSEPTVAILFEEWTDDAALNDHKRRPHFAILQQIKTEYVKGTEFLSLYRQNI